MLHRTSITTRRSPESPHSSRRKRKPLWGGRVLGDHRHATLGARPSCRVYSHSNQYTYTDYIACRSFFEPERGVYVNFELIYHLFRSVSRVLMIANLDDIHHYAYWLETDCDLRLLAVPRLHPLPPVPSFEASCITSSNGSSAPQACSAVH